MKHKSDLLADPAVVAAATAVVVTVAVAAAATAVVVTVAAATAVVKITDKT